jgi:hypothetical protein
VAEPSVMRMRANRKILRKPRKKCATPTLILKWLGRARAVAEFSRRVIIPITFSLAMAR